MHIRNWTGLVRKKSYFPICQGADEKCLYTLDEYFKDLNNEIYYLPCYNNLKYIKDLSEKKGAICYICIDHKATSYMYIIVYM